ncbi:MAG: S41 family peptidase [Bacteroidales bacterium]|nr:S41 family peptidase [Bacteroidales bacterium]MDD3989619.1 S41 family peptidase [Bacteroidales bacterium]
MKTIKKIWLTILIIIIITPLFSQSREFRTARSLEVQTAVLRELSALYVDSVDLEKLIRTGIDAMLESLDPYTVFIPEEDEENLRLMTTGSYGGIGAVIRKVEGGILIAEITENSPAAKVRLAAGDTIIMVGGRTTAEMTTDSCSALMKGVPGSSVTLKVRKLRGGKDQEYNIVRDKIHFPNVAYSAMIEDTVGYIRISGFTVGAAKEVKKALLALKNQPGLKRVLIDLRGNGGGLLDEAVGIVSLFVPRGTPVVTARGRIRQADMDYNTKEEPVDTLIPLVVLVNSGSASSSEIVAGALQDLDRATIAGTRTFGKGLVQSIRDLGYNNTIKLTTAKYYTPSGRCVQAIDYSVRNQDGSVGYIPDSLRKSFKTLKGRTVYDGGGITPDVAIEAKSYSRPALSLVYEEILSEYSLLYYRDHDSVANPSHFTLTDPEYEEFIKYAVTKEFDNRSGSEVEFDKFLAIAAKESFYSENKKEIDQLSSRIKLGKEAALRREAAEIRSLLEEEISSRYYFQTGRIKSILRNDTQALEACRVKLNVSL